MADNLSLQSPDFDLIQKEAGVGTRDGVNLIWAAMNFEIATRRQTVRQASQKMAPAILSVAPTANQNNLDLENSSILLYTGSTNVTLSGIRAPSAGESRILVLHNVGSATISVAHNSGSSDALNRIRTYTAGTVSVTTDLSMILLYLNSLWRELKLA